MSPRPAMRWRASQPELKAERLVFIDETGAATDMARRYGRCPRGERLVCQRAVGTLENDDLRCSAAARRDRRALCAGRTDGWGKLSRLCRAVRRPDPYGLAISW